MTAVGNDVTITIGGTNYTSKVVSYTESGGEKNIALIRTLGNTYKEVVTGRTDYLLTIRFKHDDLNLSTLFESDSAIAISIAIGTETTISYANMIPKSCVTEIEPNGVSYTTIIYSTSAYNSSGTTNRSMT